MIAYKGFNKDMTCTKGRGTYKYKIGETYREKKSQCASTGFHCVEEPIEVLTWYPNGRYCMVSAEGDIHEDGTNKIACTEMRILKELTLEQIGILECEWINEHPERECSKLVERDTGKAVNGIVVVRGKNPKAAGKINSTIFLIKENRRGKVVEIGAYRIDGKKFHKDQYYDVKGRCAE